MVGCIYNVQSHGKESKMVNNIERKKIDWSKVLLAFLIAVFLFSFGMLLGYLGSKIIEGASISIADSTKNEIANLETLNELEKSYPCSSSTLDIATNRLGYLSDIIDSMETQRGKNDAEVLELKKLYSVVEVRHMLLLKQREENCHANYTIMLYFYSNDKECKDSVDSVAFILTYMRNKYPNVRVYSYDIGLKSDVVDVLKENYNVTGCYKVIVNEQNVGEVNKSDDLEKYIK